MEFILVKDGDGNLVVIDPTVKFRFGEDGYVEPNEDQSIRAYDGIHYIDKGSTFEETFKEATKGLRKQSKKGRRIKLTVEML